MVRSALERCRVLPALCGAEFLPNQAILGLPLQPVTDLYYTIVSLSTPMFFVAVIVLYVAVVSFFGALYYFSGAEGCVTEVRLHAGADSPHSARGRWRGWQRVVVSEPCTLQPCTLRAFSGLLSSGVFPVFSW